IALDLKQTGAADADIRLGVSSMPTTAWAYTTTEATQGGNVWLGTTYLASPAKGNYAYLTIMHEIGHALGLSHPHEESNPAAGAEPDDGLCPCLAGAIHGQVSAAQSAPSAATAAAIDAMAHTIMSYRSYEGQSVSVGYTN